MNCRPRRIPLTILSRFVLYRAGYCLSGVCVAPCFMSVEAMMQNMIDELTDAMKDAAKHDKGVNAAGTRVRKTMQSIKAAAQDVRKQVQADRS